MTIALPRLALALTAATLLSLPHGAALAADDPCQTQRNTVEMNECAVQTLKAKDQALNQAWSALMDNLKPDRTADGVNYTEVRQKLQTAQRAWIQFRDADCSAKYDFNITGSIRNLAALQCKIEHTEQRTRQLQDWVK